MPRRTPALSSPNERWGDAFQFDRSDPRADQHQARRPQHDQGSAGNLVEWYDVYVYTVFATYFEAQFFDQDDENSTLYIYAIFAVTFVMRPVGSWFFGRFADRRGRKAALMVSITVMSSCSFVVAVMPTREVIGYWAAVILIAARLLQGFATGGEYGTSATYMSEAATRAGADSCRRSSTSPSSVGTCWRSSRC